MATTDYFSAAAVEVPLLHMWSLSVEEQFYLVWPALLIAWTNCRTPFVRRVSIGLLVVTSFTLSVWPTAKHPSAAFHLVPSRAWEFGAGAVVGVASMGKYTLRSSTALFLTLTGLALIFSSVIGYDHATGFPGVAAIPPVLGTAALIEGLRHRPESLVGTVLANRGVVQVGLLSYGWYLWHWPLLSLLHHATLGQAGVLARAFVAACGLGAAWVSYQFVEQPVRQSRWLDAFEPKRTIVLGGLVSLGLALVVIGVGEAASQQGDTAVRSLDPLTRKAVETRFQGTFPKDCNVAEVPAVVAGCVSNGETASFVLAVGDSHMFAWLPFGVDLAAARGRGLISLSKNSCPYGSFGDEPNEAWRIRDSDCLRHNRDVRAIIRTGEVLHRPVKTLLLAERLRHGFSVADSRKFGAEPDTTFRVRMRGAIEDAIAGGVEEIFIFAPSPELRLPAWRCLLKNVEGWCQMPRPVFEQSRAERIETLRSLERDFTRVHVIDPIDVLCDTRACPVARDGTVLYWDDDHVSWAANRLLYNRAARDM